MVYLGRSEEANDLSAIFAVQRACFSSESEARLVDALRLAGRLAISLVAVADDRVIGHVAFSPVTTDDGRTGLGLGPIAVIEERRRQGVGGYLVRTGLQACKAAGYGWAVVLGEPSFYGRFGFEPAAKFGLVDGFQGGPHFQAVELIDGQMPTGAGLVHYAPEFDAVA